MSRGGRGGFGGGRGGLSSAARLNSGAVPFDIDEELEKEFAKQKEDSDNFFPEHFPHLAAPPTELELEEVHRYLDICSRMSKGWLAEAIRKLDAKKVERAKQMEQYNPFEDVPQYGKKTTAEKVPRFSDFPFKKEHFPKELWDVIDPKGESDNPDARKKTLKINTKSTRDKLADFDEDDEVENEADNEAAEKKNPEDDEVEELEDDEFDEDENDDMADDYNGEKYFEDGEEDYEDGGGGGDDDGDGY